MTTVKLSEDIVWFLGKLNVVMISTFGSDGEIHCAVKGIAGFDECGKIFVIDLFKNKTYKNLGNNPSVSITAFDEEKFVGYTFRGTAKIVLADDIDKNIIKDWEGKIIGRISQRVINGLVSGVKTTKHHEASLPQNPKHLIEVDVASIVDLAPFTKE